MEIFLSLRGNEQLFIISTSVKKIVLLMVWNLWGIKIILLFIGNWPREIPIGNPLSSKKKEKRLWLQKPRPKKAMNILRTEEEKTLKAIGRTTMIELKQTVKAMGKEVNTI